MRRVIIVTLLAGGLAGCGNLRLAPTEAQKRNAWSHMQTTRTTAATAREEKCSTTVCNLAALSARQAEAFAADYGMPDELPQDGTVEHILAEANWVTADQAMSDSRKEPDGWVMTEGLLELGAALAGLLGGAYGSRLLRFIDEARMKSEAIKEIVQGNELFKKRNPGVVSDFKESHSLQSEETRRLVASLK